MMSWSTVWHSNCVRTNQTVCKIRKYDESANSFMEYIILWHNDCLPNMLCVRNCPFKYKKICKTRNLVLKSACIKWILHSNTFLFDVQNILHLIQHLQNYLVWQQFMTDGWGSDWHFPCPETRWHNITVASWSMAVIVFTITIAV